MLDTLLSSGVVISTTLNPLVVLAIVGTITFFLYLVLSRVKERVFLTGIWLFKPVPASDLRGSKAFFLGPIVLAAPLLDHGSGPDIFSSPLMGWVFGLFGLLAVIGLMRLASGAFIGERSIATFAGAGQGAAGSRLWAVAAGVTFLIFATVGDALRGPDHSWVLQRAADFGKIITDFGK